MQKIKHIHYAWVICILGMLLIFVSMGVVSNGFSMYLPYLISEYGFSNSQTSFLVNIRCIVSFIAMFCIGKYYQVFSLRVGTTIAAVCACMAYMLYSLSDNYVTFCIGAAVSGLSYGLGSMIPVTILMNNWFVRHKALALGICATGSSVAMIFMPPCISLLITHISLRGSFCIVSIGLFVLAIAIAAFMRDTPEEKGVCSYGQQGIESEEAVSSMGEQDGYNAMPMFVWFYIGGASLCMGVLANPGFSHLSVLYTTEGYSPIVVALIISSLGIVMVIAKPLCGEIIDYLGGLKASVIFGCLLFVGYAACCLAFAENRVVCIISILCMGAGIPIATIGIPAWAGDLAPKGRYAEVVRKLQVIYAGGALCFASIPGIMADRFGSYIPAYVLFSGLIVLSMIFIVLAYYEKGKL